MSTFFTLGPTILFYTWRNRRHPFKGPYQRKSFLEFRDSWIASHPLGPEALKQLLDYPLFRMEKSLEVIPGNLDSSALILITIMVFSFMRDLFCAMAGISNRSLRKYSGISYQKGTPFSLLKFHFLFALEKEVSTSSVSDPNELRASFRSGKYLIRVWWSEGILTVQFLK